MPTKDTIQQFISHHRLRYLGYLKLESIKHRRTDADKKFFNGISQPDNCLHHLPPPPRDTQLVTRLRRRHRQLSTTRNITHNTHNTFL